MQKEAQSWNIIQRLRERVKLMKETVGRRMAERQKRFERDYDKKAHQEAQIRVFYEV